MIACPGCGEENPPRFRLCGFCGTPLRPDAAAGSGASPAPPPPAEPAPAAALPASITRRTVTVLFADLVGSTSLAERLDPEAMLEVKSAYFSAVAAAIARHGGTVEKYIGDAVMAVFGVPVAHEDDALRAVRAADAMRSALRQLNDRLAVRHDVTLVQRIGLDTGVVVASTAAGRDQQLATGDVVNVAARLQSAAEPGHILIGEGTHALVRLAVEARPVAPLVLKGKSQPVPAWSLGRMVDDGGGRRHELPMTGREVEQQALRTAFDGVCTEGRPVLISVLGDAGAGKSRLLHEFLDGLPTPVRVLHGRCLPYGEDITFWPLLMLVRGAAGIGDGDDIATSRAKLAACVPDADVAERLASIAGLRTGGFPLADIRWAARRFLHDLAAAGPVVVALDDLHWAAPAFLDLLLSLAAAEPSRPAPLLMLAAARTDLLDTRADWCTQPATRRLVLPPLDAAATTALVTAHLSSLGLHDTTLARRIAVAADGNPLYLDQMLALLAERGSEALGLADDGALALPPTVQALLAARLERLDRAGRLVLDPASVIGLEFVEPALHELVHDALRERLGDRLDDLARQQFVVGSAGVAVEGDGSAAPAADGERWRFRHHLVREAVYGALLKRTRAQWHRDFVRWADRHNAAHDQAMAFEEILGWHLEQAHACLRDLGPLDEDGHALGRDASRRLASAGRRAASRGDVRAATRLLRRALALLEADDADRHDLLPDLADAATGAGDFETARGTLDALAAAAATRGDLRLDARARMGRALLALHSGQPGPTWGEDALALSRSLVSPLEAAGLRAEAAAAWRLAVMVHGIAGRYAAVDDAVARAVTHARAAGDSALVARTGTVMVSSALFGPLPVDRAIATCDALLDGGVPDRRTECFARCTRALLQAMAGDPSGALQAYHAARTQVQDLGDGMIAAAIGPLRARVAERLDDPAAELPALVAEVSRLESVGESYYRSTLAGLVARLLHRAGRVDEALHLTDVAAAISADDDAESQSIWRAARARLLADAGAFADAEALAHEAVTRAGTTESPLLQAEACEALAAVMAAAGRPEDAGAARRRALALFAAKGDRTMAARLAATDVTAS